VSRFSSWAELDSLLWRLVWEWDCVHSGFCRCAVVVLVNRSHSPVQLDRVQLLLGRNVVFMGTLRTGYRPLSRIVDPAGSVVLFACAVLQSPLEAGYVQLRIESAVFAATIASTQGETSAVGKGGHRVGFLEKISKDWWSKYVIIVT